MTPDSSDKSNSEPRSEVSLPSWLPLRSTFTTSLNVRIGLAVYGILVPIVCHLITLKGSPDPARWQSGELSDKLSFLLSGECGWPIFPLLIFAMICLGMAIGNEAWAFAKPWVRFGIFSGVMVCGWYLLAFSWTAMGSPWSILGLLLGGAVWLLVVHGLIHAATWAIRSCAFHFDLIPILVSLAGLAIFLCVGLVVTGNGEAFALFFVPVVIILIISTPLAFLTYLWMSIRILVLHVPARRFTMAQLMILVTWLAAFAAALRATIEKSYLKYAELPLEPPENCYIATAASKGYPRIVGSQNLPTTAEQPMPINSQLATFKAAELTLRTLPPNTHRAFRFFYDRLGPPAAAMLYSPLLATATYLCLKPAEWFCWIVLRILLGRSTFQLAQQLYALRANHLKR